MSLGDGKVGSTTTLFMATAVWLPRRVGGSAVVCYRDSRPETVRIQQHFLAIESVASLWIARPVGPIGVHLAGLQARHEHVPLTRPGGHTEVDAVGVDRRSKRRSGALLDLTSIPAKDRGKGGDSADAPDTGGRQSGASAERTSILSELAPHEWIAQA
jgi:hypothetical protein